jgi:hypothetical protein
MPAMLNGYDIVRSDRQVEILCSTNGECRARAVLDEHTGQIKHVDVEPSNFGREAIAILAMLYMPISSAD